MQHGDAHALIYEYFKDIYDEYDRDCVLKQCFTNYRYNTGLKLSLDCFNICKKNKIFNFTKITRPKIFDSRHMVVLDISSKTPYYFNTRSIYISDEDLIFQLTMNGDNFDLLIEYFK